VDRRRRAAPAPRARRHRRFTCAHSMLSTNLPLLALGNTPLDSVAPGQFYGLALALGTRHPRARSIRAGAGRVPMSGWGSCSYMSNGDPPDEPEATAGWGAVAQFPDPDPLDRGGWGAAAVVAGVGGGGPQSGVVGWGGLPSGAAPATAVAAAPTAAVVDTPVPALPEVVVAASTVAAGLTSPAAAYMPAITREQEIEMIGNGDEAGMKADALSEIKRQGMPIPSGQPPTDDGLLEIEDLELDVDLKVPVVAAAPAVALDPAAVAAPSCRSRARSGPGGGAASHHRSTAPAQSTIRRTRRRRVPRPVRSGVPVGTVGLWRVLPRSLSLWRVLPSDFFHALVKEGFPTIKEAHEAALTVEDYAELGVTDPVQVGNLRALISDEYDRERGLGTPD
jgi:hypothetical protein